MFQNAVFWILLLIFCFSLLKYTYDYNYRSHISLQVAKLAKSAGVQILIFPTVCATYKDVYTFLHFTLMARCTSGAFWGSVSCLRTLRQGIELATFCLLNDFFTSCTTVTPILTPDRSVD